jgi:nitrate/nitrite transporter NarK
MRTGYRRTFAILSLLGIAVGLVVSTRVPPAFAIAALCVATAGIISCQPIFWTYPTAYFGGLGAAAGLAAINALGNLGGLVAPTVKTWCEASFHSQAAGLYFLAVAAVSAAVLVGVLRDSAWPQTESPEVSSALDSKLK